MTITTDKSLHVPTNIEKDQPPTRPSRSIVDSLIMPGVADIEFDPPCVTIEIVPEELTHDARDRPVK